MSRISKNIKKGLDRYKIDDFHSLKNASELIKEISFSKFDASVDMDIRLGVDPKKADQMVRGVVVLPHGTGKTLKVLALVSADKEAEAKEAGADYVGLDDYIEKHKVNKFYTAPTALRALMKEGDKWPNKYNLDSLRILGTVGEPIKEPEWLWYHNVIGKQKCPIVDTWWQTETGGVMITPLPGVTSTKPGSATLPFFGVVPELLDDEGNVLEGNNVEGNLAIQRPWPSIMRTVYGDHQRFFETYFEKFPGKYFSGDGCKRDEDGYYWITGRVDDVIIVSGHNLGTAEIEGSIGGHPSVAEAAVVGYPHEIKGNAIYAFVTLRTGYEVTSDTKNEIVKRVRADIGPHASPEKIQFTEGLPKTRSGKIMRRILRNIASDKVDELGDISTLADPSVVSSLVDERI